MTNRSTLPAGAEKKGALSAMPSRISPGPPKRWIHFHTESDIIMFMPFPSSRQSGLFVFEEFELTEAFLGLFGCLVRYRNSFPCLGAPGSPGAFRCMVHGAFCRYPPK